MIAAVAGGTDREVEIQDIHAPGIDPVLVTSVEVQVVPHHEVGEVEATADLLQFEVEDHGGLHQCEYFRCTPFYF